MELRRILYGYRKEQFEFYVVPEEAVIVRRIFNEYIGGKREKDSEEIIYLKNNLFCGVCGNKLTRRKKYTTHERWVCANGCHKHYEYLDDEVLISKIQSILCFVKENPSFLMVKSAAKPYTPTREVILKEKQVKNMIFEPKPLFQPIKALLYSAVNDKYYAMDFDTSKRFTNALCEYV